MASYSNIGNPTSPVSWPDTDPKVQKGPDLACLWLLCWEYFNCQWCWADTKHLATWTLRRCFEAILYFKPDSKAQRTQAQVCFDYHHHWRYISREFLACSESSPHPKPSLRYLGPSMIPKRAPLRRKLLWFLMSALALTSQPELTSSDEADSADT